MPIFSPLTLEALSEEARVFAEIESTFPEPTLFGATDGKRVGNYFEQKFHAYLRTRFIYREGNAAEGIDFPDLNVDTKTTSIRKPQSSCPFRSVRQKVYGLGYNLLVFVYEKTDDAASRTAVLDIQHTIFVERHRTADFGTTNAIRQELARGANEDDIMALIMERSLLLDEIEARALAEEVMARLPELGYLTISPAFQWRLAYGRAITQAGTVDGIHRLR